MPGPRSSRRLPRLLAAPPRGPAPLLAPFLAAALSSCLYNDTRSPRAYRSATPAEVQKSAEDPIASGEACNQYVLYLVGWGRGGYAGATRKALEGRPDGILYDVKTDIKVKSVLLGLYARVCTVVTGKVSRP